MIRFVPLGALAVVVGGLSCTTRPPLPASQSPPAADVPADPFLLADVPAFWRNLADWRSRGDCYALELVDANLQVEVERFAAAYNRAAKMDPIAHATEVLKAKVLLASTPPESRPKPGDLTSLPAGLATLNVYELSQRLGLYKAALAEVRRVWRRTCRE